ncbi:MAG: hypothetical protein AAF530_21495 [Pseudomonadota bacterium]
MSEPFATEELRWMFEGACPKDVWNWYRRLAWASVTDGKGKPSAPQREQRSDLYFILDGREDLGLKLRGDKLQLKTRLDQHSLAVEGTIKATGRLESWHRFTWSSDGVQAAGFQAALADNQRDGRRVDVAKIRWQSSLPIDQIKAKSEKAGNGKAEAAKAKSGKRPGKGADGKGADGKGSPTQVLSAQDEVRREPGFLMWELVEIAFAKHQFWSLSLETDPGEMKRGKTQKLMAKLLQDYPGPALTGKSSMGYPAMLLGALGAD